jgi:hypothetical protein
MLRRFRRLHLLAVVLMLGVPGLGGAWLQTLHPCPVDAPWIAQDASGGDSHSPGGGHGHAEGSDSCQCLGACVAAFVAPAVRAAQLAQAPFYDWIAPAPPARASFLPAARPPHLRPPATAPPLA